MSHLDRSQSAADSKAAPHTETPDTEIQIVLGKQISCIDRSVEALAKWLEKRPAPDVKPTGNDNAGELAFLITLRADQRGYGHPGKGAGAPQEVFAVHGAQFDLDGGNLGDMRSTFEAVASSGYAALAWMSHSATSTKPAGRLIVLYDSPAPPDVHERIYPLLVDQLCPWANTRAQKNSNRGWNRPRASTKVRVQPGALVDWRALLACAPAPSKLKRPPAEIPAPLPGLVVPAAAVVDAWVAAFPKARGKRDVCFAFGGWACRQGIPVELACDFMAAVLARIPEVESVAVGVDSVSESFARLQAGGTAYGRPKLIELLSSDGPAALSELERAWGLKPARVDLTALGVAEPTAPNVEIQINHDMASALDLAEQGLARRDDLFVWQGAICQALGGRLVPLTTENIRTLSSSMNDWMQWDSDAEEWRRTRADRSICQALKDRGHWPHMKPVRAVVSSPVWVNGKVLGAPGYDVQSQLYYDGLAYQRTPRPEPTADLVAELLSPFRHFPWKVEGARTAAASYLFSLLMQYDYDPPTPLHAFSAAMQNTGKGMLARGITCLALGRPASITVYPPTAEELNKAVLGILAHGGRRSVLWDEPGRTVGGNALRAVLTSMVYEGRKLGVNETIGGLNFVVWCVLGNMLRLGDDMARRVVAIALDVQTATDLPDLLEEIETNRPALLDCAFELITRWESEGKPKIKGGVFPSFEAWSRKVESLLSWAGLPSLRSNVDELQDAQVEEQSALFDLVERACAPKGGEGATPAEILAVAKLDEARAAEAFGERVNHKTIAAALRSCQVAKGGTRLVRPTKRTWRVQRAT